MTGPVQPDFSDLVRSYRESFAAHGDTPAAVQWPKGRQELRWNALTSHLPTGTQGSFLDFGCGLGHFKGFMEARYPGSTYTGADVVPEFIAHGRRAHPEAGWQLLSRVQDLQGEHDFVVLSGVFNKLCCPDAAGHRAYVQQALAFLFSRARVSLSVDFMSDRVDFTQPGAYHQGVQDIRAFALDNLSPRVRIDESYMPYEFALTVFRDATVVRPDNVYRP